MLKDRVEELAGSNLGLAHSCARRYLGRGIEYDDLLQAASLGLVKAARGFDESRGLRFSTYAVPVIMGEIKQLFRSSSSVKLSRELQSLAARAAREAENFEQLHLREPHISELAQIMSVTPEEAAQALCASRRPISLTQDSEDEKGNIDIPADVFDGDLTERLALVQSIAKLSSEDRRLITERYVNLRTQCSTGQLLGMSQVQVSRREKKILKALRELME